MSHMIEATEQVRKVDGRDPLLERYRGPVESYMRSLLQRVDSLPTTMLEYHLGYRNESGLYVPDRFSSGKGLRPTLCLLTNEAVGGTWPQAVPGAAALELLHNGTLVHDDIQDGDSERHGKPTVWAKDGINHGINTGDMAFFLSNAALLDLREAGYSPEVVLDVVNLMTRTGIELARGQGMDMAFEGNLQVTPQEYMRMIRGKTGILVETSIVTGAMLGGADAQTTESLKQYGGIIGQAFQISDDKLGIWGDPAKTGKTVGADIRRRKLSYPILDALQHADGTTRSVLEEIYLSTEELTDTQVETVMEILDGIGTKARITDILQRASSLADEAIRGLDIENKSDFYDLTNLVANRER